MRLLPSILAALCLAAVAQAEPAYRTVAHLPAQPLTPQVMSQIRGKATPALMQFLQTATQTQLGGGVVLWTLCPDGCAVTATWNTGSTSGTTTVAK